MLIFVKILNMYTAITWLEYCRYGVKHKTINQSICITGIYFGLILSIRLRILDVLISMVPP